MISLSPKRSSCLRSRQHSPSEKQSAINGVPMKISICRIARLFLASGLLLSSTASGQSSDETVHAIERIYGDQSGCVKNAYWSIQRFDARFSAETSEISFLFRESRNDKDEQWTYEYRFNPANLDRIEERPASDGNSPHLQLTCKKDAGMCIYFSGWDENSAEEAVPFCSESARDRVGNALRHLSTLLEPSKPLAF